MRSFAEMRASGATLQDIIALEQRFNELQKWESRAKELKPLAQLQEINRKLQEEVDGLRRPLQEEIARLAEGLRFSSRRESDAKAKIVELNKRILEMTSALRAQGFTFDFLELQRLWEANPEKHGLLWIEAPEGDEVFIGQYSSHGSLSSNLLRDLKKFDRREISEVSCRFYNGATLVRSFSLTDYYDLLLES